MFALIQKVKASLAGLVESINGLSDTFREVDAQIREQARLDGPGPEALPAPAARVNGRAKAAKE